MINIDGKKAAGFLLLSLFFLGVSGSGLAAERLVPTVYATIQDAIDASSNGDEVVIATGTYTGSGNRDISFDGKAIIVRSTDPEDAGVVATTIIDCQGTSGDQHRGFYIHNGEGPNSVVAGLTITGAYNTGSWPNWGGAFYLSNTNPTIRNCRILGNYGTWGAGVSCYNSDPTILSCTIGENNGDGIAGSDSYPTISNCTIIGNSNRGLYTISSNSIFTITNSILWDNGSWSEGWQIYGLGTFDLTYSCVQGLLEYATPSLHNIGYDPLWIDRDGPDNDPDAWADNDYHLSDNSPCINAGDPSGDYTGQTDMDGDPRVMLGLADIGADEYSSAFRSFVPEAYTPSSPVAVSIALPADATVISVSLEDAPPAGWTVSGISNGGFWNAGAGKVEWGPFPQGSIPNSVNYDTTPPGNESGDQWFSGTAWYDGGPVPIGGEVIHQALIHNVTQDKYYTTIQDAIDMAVDYDEIVLQPHTYTGDGNRDIEFRGKAITVRSTDPDDPAVVASTIIDCQGSASDMHRGFYIHSGEGADSVVASLTITGSYFSGSWPDYGGGFFIRNADPTILNCRIIGNQGIWGAGIRFENSESKIINSTICDNTGDGIDGSSSDVTITNCTVVGNSGRGLYATSSDTVMTVTNCIVWDNGSGTEAYQVYGMGTFDLTYSCIQGCAAYCSPKDATNMGNDPLFVNPGGNDYHLQATPVPSPSIDSGNNSAPDLPSTDIDGDPRIVNAVVDMGVDEVNDNPDLVEMASFTALEVPEGVLVLWVTLSEIDNEGFRVLRAEDEGGGYASISGPLIPSAGGPTWGSAYEFVDVDVSVGETWFYKLEAIDLYGNSTLFGPVSVLIEEPCFVHAALPRS
ncbi:right-handed parallel beta-helix repeat-containing protein [Thermodesulfobacteriota bacterium]